MAHTKTFGHKVDKKGRVVVVETTLPKRLRGRSEYAADTYTGHRITRAAAVAVWRGLKHRR